MQIANITKPPFDSSMEKELENEDSNYEMVSEIMLLHSGFGNIHPIDVYGEFTKVQ
jgi:hypothetical protein